MIDSEAAQHAQLSETPHHTSQKARRDDRGQVLHSTAQPAPARESALGSLLAEVLANPDRTTIGAYAAVLDQIHAELSLLQPLVAREPLSAASPDVFGEEAFAALFEGEHTAAPLSAHDIDMLAASLLPHDAPLRL
jgi:hypothetical protein